MIERGDVFKIRLDLPSRAAGIGTTTRTKYVVALQGGRGADGWTDIAVVIASTARSRNQRSFEVEVDSSHGFSHRTFIDCRWVRTLLKSDLPRNAEFRLDASVMHDISVALVKGLQLS